MSDTPPLESEGPRLSGLAVASLVLGALSPGLSLLGSVPAMFLGLHGLRAINAAPDRLRGRGAAIAGMALGALVTLLTFVGVVGVILLRVNDQSARVRCTENLRVIGLAVNVYHDANAKHYPAAAIPSWALPPQRRLSWTVRILPYLDQGASSARTWQRLVGQLDAGQPWDGPANEAGLHLHSPRWLCPAWQPPQPRPVQAWTTYVGLAGVGSDAAELPLSDPRAGFFGYYRRPSRQDVRAGISNTLMAAETMEDLGPWIAGDAATVRGLDPDEEDYAGFGRPWGGLHADGINVLMVDGSARLMRPPIEPTVLRRQATLVGGEE
jgi:prepilin-type processing-associated H-X9-DG protein